MGGLTGFNSLWFAVFLQLVVILGVLYTLATDSISMHRFQISIFGAIAIVFAVQGVTAGIFVPHAAFNAMGAGWLILAIVDILWVLYFTSEEDSLALYIFNMLGTGGLTPPSRRRRTRSSMHMQTGNGYPNNYASGGIGSHDYDGKAASGNFASPKPDSLRNQTSFGGSFNDNMMAFGPSGGAGSINNQGIVGGAGSAVGNDNGPTSPLMSGVGAGNSSASATNVDVVEQPENYSYKAKAMYACKWDFSCCWLSINLFNQTPQIRMILMKYHSRKAKFSILWINQGSGGKQGKLMEQQEVRFDFFSTFLLLLTFSPFSLVAPSNYLQPI